MERSTISMRHSYSHKKVLFALRILVYIDIWTIYLVVVCTILLSIHDNVIVDMSKLKQITNPHKNILQDFEKRVSNWIHLIDAFDGLSLAVPSITPSIFYIYKKNPQMR